MTRLMQLCWETKSVPTAWRLAQAILIYKKGPLTECENYRPISLISILHKVYANILLNRLKAAGAERRLWHTQFGFRSARSTEDALFIVRRRLEQAWASRGGKYLFLVLDWRRAFDGISPSRLTWALKRFGIPELMLEAVVGIIYTDRQFIVQEDGGASNPRPQKAGISQGCPLSPFLFGILMSILMVDAREKLTAEAKEAWSKDRLGEVLYADDALIYGESGKQVEEYSKAVEQCGAEYGLQIHSSKFQLLKASTQQNVWSPEGKTIEDKESMVYLGASVHANGRANSEVGRKIGLAHADFKNLSRVWRHAATTRKRKLELFNAMIVSRLRYSTASLWLTKPELRRLDGFHCRCLRQILGVQPSFISRVSNDKVLKLASQDKLSETIRSAQLQLLAKVLVDLGKKDIEATDIPWRKPNP